MSSGVKWEAQLISAAMYDNISGESGVRVIPIIRNSTLTDELPTHFRMLNSIDFSYDENYELELKRLLISLHGLDEVAGQVLEAPKDKDGKLSLRLENPSPNDPTGVKPTDADNVVQKPKVTPWQMETQAALRNEITELSSSRTS